MAEEGFFSRWSRLKSDARAPEPEPRPAAAHAPASDGEQRRLPTLEDVQQLDRDSDYSAFVAPDVDPSVRRLAMRKLFADPHFNVRDGLDVYMGDYTQPSPVPAAMLASLAHASAWLGLGPKPEHQPAPDTATTAASPVIPVQAGIHAELGTPVVQHGSRLALGRRDTGEPQENAAPDAATERDEH